MGTTKHKSKLREYIEAIVYALILAMILRSFVIQAYKIPSGSMIPTLLVGDHILVNKFIFGLSIPFTDKKYLAFRNPERGDVIVFKYPEDESRDFIKRVIGKEGDIIEVKDKVLYVNGKTHDEKYAQYTEKELMDKALGPRDEFGPVTVPKGKLFVMGDNRDHSLDSRFWGFVDLNQVRGEAVIMYWSWDSDTSWVRFNRIGRLIK
ncbi:MAG: signal peptidase I [Nitrospirae bacterium]|nr:signal peptidase I [Nitrospirota bacterium]